MFLSTVCKKYVSFRNHNNFCTEDEVPSIFPAWTDYSSLTKGMTETNSCNVFLCQFSYLFLAWNVLIIRADCERAEMSSLCGQVWFFDVHP